MKRPLEFLTVFIFMIGRMASAQESLRNSMAGDAAAAADKLQLASQAYTYKAGDFRLLLAPSMEADYNDNVLLAKTNAESDVILQPGLQLTASYPLTQRNLLSLNVGVSYLEYVEHSTNSSLALTSGSQLSFSTYIKDFVINFHDRFSLSDNPSGQPTVAETGNYGSFVNDAGITINWDLNNVVLTLGYDHQNTISAFSQFNYLDNSAELPLARAGIHLRPTLTAGVEASATYTTYAQNVLNDNENYSMGVYADWKPSPALRVSPRVGYSISDFQHTSQSIDVYRFGAPPPSAPGASIETQDVDSWYADLTVSHQITKAIGYGFSAGHEVLPGIEADLVEDYYFRPNINWAIINGVNLTTTFFYQYGNQGTGNITGNLVETYSYYGAGLTAGYQLMKKLLLTLNYHFTYRSSTVADLGYLQDIVGLRLTYQL